MRWLRSIIIGLIAVALGGAITYGILRMTATAPDTSVSVQREQEAPSLIDDSTLQDLRKVDRSSLRTARLARGLTPPTNTWFSSILSSKQEPFYTYPNSVLLTSSGFELSLPTVTASADLISAPHTPDLTVRIDKAKRYTLERYDELTIDVAYFDARDNKLATITLAAGLPYVYLKAERAVTGSVGVTVAGAGDAVRLKSGDKTFGAYPALAMSGSNLRLSSGQTLTLFSAPKQADFDDVAKYAGAVVSGSEVSYAPDGSNIVTTFNYKTKDEKPVLFARLAHQQTGGNKQQPAYRSTFGDMTTSAGVAFGYELPKMDIKHSLAIADLSSEDRKLLQDTLVQDVRNMPAKKTDTYFGGKQLQRTAQLLDIAGQLRTETETNKLTAVLRKQLDEWLKRSGEFEYDTKARTIVGREASFGAATDINDHHFHYGYFVYASAVLAKYDTSFYDTHAEMVNLLVADIANYKDDEKLPLRRNFDAYAGHSWASGTAAFRDGNNQESTSEAINAWVAVALWADVSKNDTLRQQAEWMLAHEAATARRYWLNQPATKAPYLQPYTSPLASLVWGAKREYKTFFSDEPNAKLAIQLLPLTPTMQDYVARLPQPLFRGTDATKTYADSIVMARKSSTIDDVKKLPDNLIDDGNSPTYMYAFMLTR